MVAPGADSHLDNYNRSRTAANVASRTEIDPSTQKRSAETDDAVQHWRPQKAGRKFGSDVSGERFWDEQGLLWCAFAFASGIGVYFVLPAEPSFIVLSGVCAGAALVSWIVCRWRALSRPVVLLLACFAGLMTGSVRGELVDTPRLAEPMSAEIIGRIVERSARPDRVRLVLSVERINRHHAEDRNLPKKIRLRVPRDSPGAVGDRVRIKGRLFPPAGPVHPGGYDFSFRAYFSQIGASGFSFGPAELLEGGAAGADMQIAASIANVRSSIAGYIRSVLAERPEAALIVAVLVGDRSGITEEQEDVLRASGLAHILAISGLHMALFAGGTYGAALLVLAAVPGLSLRWPTHKWAALAALVAATLYLLLSGASVATQRSYLMIALVFLGLLVGRRGLTLRSVALAGIVLLVLAPERLFYPGFQMSFAAVICLVAVYDLWRRRQADFITGTPDQGLGSRVWRSGRQWIIGLFVTALVAGLATGIVGAYHFGRIAPFGLLGNVLGMPVFTLVVMPMGVAALALMPFGLAALPLWLMSLGVSVLMKIAAFTAELDAGRGVIGKLDGPTALLLVLALFAGLLLPGRWRLSAVLLFVAGTAFAVQSRPPDVQVAASGTRMAARDADGDLKYSARANSFATELWYRTEGISLRAIKPLKMIAPQKRCDRQGCVVSAFALAASTEDMIQSETFLRIAMPKTLEALADDCHYAEIVVSDLVVPGDCAAALVIGKSMREKRGAFAIWLSPRLTPEHSPVGAASPDPSDKATRPDIERIVFAIPDPPRRWHRPGSVSYRSLRQERD